MGEGSGGRSVLNVPEGRGVPQEAGSGRGEQGGERGVGGGGQTHETKCEVTKANLRLMSIPEQQNNKCTVTISGSGHG